MELVNRIPKDINILKHKVAAKMCLVIARFLLVAKNKEGFRKLEEGTLIPVASKRDWQYFRPEKTEKRNNASK